MKGIEGTEKVERAIGRWAPEDLALIEGLELTNDEEAAPGTRLVITSLFQLRANRWPDFGKEMVRVVLVFDGVGELYLNGFGGVVQIMGFEIHYVGDRGLESHSYEVRDYEDGRIRFNCRGVSVRSAGVSPV